MTEREQNISPARDDKRTEEEAKIAVANVRVIPGEGDLEKPKKVEALRAGSEG